MLTVDHSASGIHGSGHVANLDGDNLGVSHVNESAARVVHGDGQDANRTDGKSGGSWFRNPLGGLFTAGKVGVTAVALSAMLLVAPVQPAEAQTTGEGAAIGAQIGQLLGERAGGHGEEGHLIGAILGALIANEVGHNDGQVAEQPEAVQKLNQMLVQELNHPDVKFTGPRAMTDGLKELVSAVALQLTSPEFSNSKILISLTADKPNRGPLIDQVRAQRRAEVLVNALVSEGVDRSRIEVAHDAGPDKIQMMVMAGAQGTGEPQPHSGHHGGGFTIEFGGGTITIGVGDNSRDRGQGTGNTTTPVPDASVGGEIRNNGQNGVVVPDATNGGSQHRQAPGANNQGWN